MKDITDTMGTFYLSHPRGLAFLAGEVANVAPAAKRRAGHERDGMRTDARRGPGVAEAIRPKMRACQERRILWGASVTVTTENFEQVTSDEYVADLHDLGCGLIVYVEYVPVDAETRDLALGLPEQRGLLERIETLHADPAYAGTMMVAFPGSEEFMGGCLAAGRGFFHIAQDGAAEPCPFSPFSVANVAKVGLEGALLWGGDPRGLTWQAVDLEGLSSS